MTSDTSVRMKPFHVGLIKTALTADHDDKGSQCDGAREVAVADIPHLSLALPHGSTFADQARVAGADTQS